MFDLQAIPVSFRTTSLACCNRIASATVFHLLAILIPARYVRTCRPVAGEFAVPYIDLTLFLALAMAFIYLACYVLYLS